MIMKHFDLVDGHIDHDNFLKLKAAVEAVNSEYIVTFVRHLSTHPEDYFLYQVTAAKKSDLGKDIVTTWMWNGRCLNHGHYGISSADAAELQDDYFEDDFRKWLRSADIETVKAWWEYIAEEYASHPEEFKWVCAKMRDELMITWDDEKMALARQLH